MSGARTSPRQKLSPAVSMIAAQEMNGKLCVVTKTCKRRSIYSTVVFQVAQSGFSNLGKRLILVSEMGI